MPLTMPVIATAYAFIFAHSYSLEVATDFVLHKVTTIVRLRGARGERVASAAA